MSIVLSVCGYNFSLMMCDGRMIKIDSGSLEIVTENFKKIERVNSRVCIGFTGDPIASMCALNELNYYEKDNLTLERIKGIVTRKLKEIQINDLGVKMIFSGRNKINKFITYELDTKMDFQETKYEPVKNGFAIVYALPPSNADLQTIVQKHIHETSPWDNIDNLKSNMRECILQISKINTTINNKIFEEMII